MSERNTVIGSPRDPRAAAQQQLRVHQLITTAPTAAILNLAAQHGQPQRPTENLQGHGATLTAPTSRG